MTSSKNTDRYEHEAVYLVTVRDSGPHRSDPERALCSLDIRQACKEYAQVMGIAFDSIDVELRS